MRFLIALTLCLPLAAQNPATAVYPNAVATDNNLFVANNNAQGTLAADISSTATSIPISNWANFVTPMYITIDGSTPYSEIVTCLTHNYGTYTCSRGAPAFGHNHGAMVNGYVVGQQTNQTNAEVKAIEATLGPNLSNIPGGTMLPSGQQTQYLQIQPNTGNLTTYRFRNLQSFSAADYNFPAQTPGGSLSIGTNTITVAPCALGINGSNSGYYIYLSGGSGVAEAVLVTGGSCTSGAPSGTVTFTNANTHSGAWGLQSASGGLAEAICALPSAGGEVLESSSVTLFSSVSSCGKASPAIRKLSGSTISGAFTLLGVSSSGAATPEYFGAASIVGNLLAGAQATYAASVYLPSIYPGGVGTASVISNDFIGAGSSTATYNGFSVLAIDDLTTTGASVVGVWSGALCRTNNCYVTGTNNLALATPGVTNAKLVGMETDVEYSVGDTSAGGSAGHYINAFNVAVNGPGIMIGGVGGGTFANGIGLTSIASGGAGVYVNAGAGSMGTFINTTQGTFSNDAIALGNAQGVLLYNTDNSTHARIWNDSSNNLRIVPGTTGNIIFRDKTDATSTGNIVGGTLQLTPNTFAGLTASVPCSNTTQGAVAYITDSSVNTWGSNAAGGGSGKVEVFCNATAWTVMGK